MHLSHLQAILRSSRHNTVSCACLLRTDLCLHWRFKIWDKPTVRSRLNMLHFVLVLGFVSSLVCQIQFPSVDLSSPTSSTLISTNQDFSRLFTLNEFGHIECQKRTDCPPDFVDTENKTVINYSCEDPISKIPNISAAPPENEDPARTCAEDLNGFYCADRTRPGCELCPGVIRR